MIKHKKPLSKEEQKRSLITSETSYSKLHKKELEDFLNTS